MNTDFSLKVPDAIISDVLIYPEMGILTESNIETYISAGCILVYNSACNWPMIFMTFLVSHFIEVANIMI